MVSPREVAWEPTNAEAFQLEANSLYRIGSLVDMYARPNRCLETAFDAVAPGVSVFTLYYTTSNLGCDGVPV